MNFSKSKWLAYTLFAGLIPVLARLLICLCTTDGKVELFSAADVLTLGLVFHISIINELEHAPRREANLKTIMNGTSLLFLTAYGVFYAAAIMGERNPGLINLTMLLCGSFIFTAISLTVSLVALQHLAKRGRK